MKTTLVLASLILIPAILSAGSFEVDKDGVIHKVVTTDEVIEARDIFAKELTQVQANLDDLDKVKSSYDVLVSSVQGQIDDVNSRKQFLEDEISSIDKIVKP